MKLMIANAVLTVGGAVGIGLIGWAGLSIINSILEIL